MMTRDLSQAINEQLPYDGPHSQETVIEAASGLYQLVRYLNNATQPSMSDHTLPCASAVGEVLDGLTAVMYGSDQLLDQLRHAMASGIAGQDVYDDRDTTRPDTGVDTAIQLRLSITELRVRLGDAVAVAHECQSHAAHLGNRR